MKTAQQFAAEFAEINRQFAAGTLTLEGLWQLLDPKPPINEDVLKAMQNSQWERAQEICGCGDNSRGCYVYQTTNAVAGLKERDGNPFVVDRGSSYDGPHIGSLCASVVEEELRQNPEYVRIVPSERGGHDELYRARPDEDKTLGLFSSRPAFKDRLPSFFGWGYDARTTPYHTVCWFMLCDYHDRDRSFEQEGLDALANGYLDYCKMFTDLPRDHRAGYVQFGPRNKVLWQPEFKKRELDKEFQRRERIVGEYGFDVTFFTQVQTDYILERLPEAESLSDVSETFKVGETKRELLTFEQLQQRMNQGTNMAVDGRVAYLNDEVVVWG